jgi:membrane-associated protein
MGLIKDLIDFILHIDKHLDTIIQSYGMWTYALVFAIVFCETGFVVTPFLPGDSLLFALGAFAARGTLDVRLVVLLLCIAAVGGDTVNYWIGAKLGPKVFHKENVRFLNRKHLQRTHEFYERHGGKTIIIARFIPIIRTFAPFVAGIGRMTYMHFLAYNVVGGIAWVLLFVLGGYFFGNLEVVRKNFSLVIIAIIVLSVIPAVVEYLRQWRAHRAEKRAAVSNDPVEES